VNARQSGGPEYTRPTLVVRPRDGAEQSYPGRHINLSATAAGGDVTVSMWLYPDGLGDRGINEDRQIIDNYFANKEAADFEMDLYKRR
jgi:hypothetical protein